MLKQLLIVGLALSVTACATEDKYRERLDGLNGFTEDQLVDAKGVPFQSYTAGSNKYMVYRTYDDPETQTEIICETTFTVIGDKIVKSTFKGDDCTSR